MGGSSKSTVGYKYYLGVDMKLCYGPIDNISRIRVDGKTVYTATTTGGRININAENVFGGDEQEGGISGAVDIEMGLPTQAPNDYLQSKLGTNIPAYRGVVGAVLRQIYIGTVKYLRAFEFRCQRIHLRQEGIEQWYDETAATYESADLIFTERFSGDLSNYTNNDPSNIYIDGARLHCDDYGNLIESDGLIRALDPIVFNFGSIRFRKIDDGIGDQPQVLIGNFFHFGPQREQNVDSAQRAHLFPAGNFFGTTKLANDNWYRLEATRDGDNIDFVLYDEANSDDVVGTITLANAGDPTTEIKFGIGTDGSAFSGGMAVEYDDLVLIGTTLTGDMNPAHIIRECLTDPDWGMGYPEADIDETSFTAAADTLFDEGFGLSLIWDRQKEIQDFIQEILKHIDASLYISRTTGKFVLKLIRNDYSLSSLTILDEDSVSRVEDYSQVSFGELVNSINVVYYDRSLSKESSVGVQDTALVQQQGAVIDTTRNYPGISNRINAARAAERDLRAMSSPLISCTVYADRTASNISIGDAFILDWPDYSIDSLVMRAQVVAYGNGRNNTIKIQCVEDVFNTPSTSTLGDADLAVTDDLNAENADPILVTEMPYWSLVRTYGEVQVEDILTNNEFSTFVVTAAGRPNDFHINAQLHYNDGAGYSQVADLDFAPFGRVYDTLRPNDTTITLFDGQDLDSVEVGTFCQKGDEIMVVNDIYQDSSENWVVEVGRGCLDTTPRGGTHDSSGVLDSSGETLIFWEDFKGYSTTEYSYGETVLSKVLGNTDEDILLLSEATETSHTTRSRPILPYPPGNFTIEGESYPDFVNADSADMVTAAWSHRDRLQQTSATIFDHTEGDIGPEAGTTYTVRLFNEFGGLESEQAGITGTSASVDLSTLITDTARIDVSSVRDGFECWMPARHTFEWNFVDSGLSDSSPLDSAGSAGASPLDSAGSAGAFDPLSLYSLGEDGGLYDPSDLSTLWQDTAGTSQVTAAGQSVARIDDKSGNGRHLTQATAGRRPTYQTSGGLHWLDFDGGDFLHLDPAAANITEGGGTLAAAATSDQAEAAQGIMEELDETGGIGTGDARNVIYFDTRATPRRLSNYAPDGTDRYINLDAEIDGAAKVFIFTSNGSTGEGYLDNTQQGSSVTTTINFTNNTRITIGRQSIGPLYLDGLFYGGLILDRGLTTQERSDLNTWLSDKAGI